MATNVRVHVARPCVKNQVLAWEATMVLRPGCSTLTVLFFFVEGLADSAIDWVVVIRAGLVRVAIVLRRRQ